MPSLVSVKIKVTRVDGTPWKRGIVSFSIINGSFTNTDQFPGNAPIKVKLNDLGENTITLWVEDEGELETEYQCTLPNGETFNFNIPIPGLLNYELSWLRLNGVTPSDPSYQTILDYINAYLGGITDYLPPGGNVGDTLKITQLNPRVVEWESNEIPPYIQIVPSTLWIYNHNLGRIPIAQVTDLNNNVKLADIQLTNTQAIVNCKIPSIGKIILR
jgi:hypothetical protein